MSRFLSSRFSPSLLVISALPLFVSFSPLMAADGPATPSATTATEAGEISWRLAGPGGGGWIPSLLWDPHDAHTLYVGCDVGGFFISKDDGRSFEVRNDGLRDYYIESIAVHPRDSNILIVGTESGIHRTTDQGHHWQWIRDGFPPVEHSRFSAPIGTVCFDPVRPNVVFAGVGRPRFDKGGAGAIYRSEDTGLTWRRVDGGQLPKDAIVSDLEFQPGNSRLIVAATSAGIFRSEDGGTSWQAANEGLPHHYVERIAFAPAKPETLYATLRCTAVDSEPWNGGIYRSDDAGRTWRSAVGTGYPKRVSNKGNARHLSTNPLDVVVDPQDANGVFVANRDWVTAGIYGTRDGGQHWSHLTRGRVKEANMDYGWLTAFGPSAESLSISPLDGHRLAFGTSGHVFVTADAGASWQQRYSQPPTADGHVAGNGLETTCVWRVQADPVRPGRVYACYMDIGLFISDDDGRTFRRSAEGMKNSGNCFGVIVDPSSPKTLWAATGWWEHNAGDICRSVDDGHTWQVVGQPASGLPDGQVLEMALDVHSAVQARRLVAISNGHGVYETKDSGTSWRAINGNLAAEVAAKPQGLLLDPTKAEHLVGAFAGTIQETMDGGQSWQQIDRGAALRDIRRLVADPHDFHTLYVAARAAYDSQAHRAFPGGVFRSTDGGKTWEHLLDCRYATDLAVSAADSRVLYVTTKEDPYFDNPIGEGILKSADGGKTWHRENATLSMWNFKTICVNPFDPARIYAGSSGNSLFVGEDKGLSAHAK